MVSWIGGYQNTSTESFSSTASSLPEINILRTTVRRLYSARRAARPAIPAMPLTARVAIGWAPPEAVEVSLPPAAAVALLAAEEALRASEDMAEPALERPDEADSATELAAAPAESVAFAAEPEGAPVAAALPPEKMVVLPRVVVMVLPSVVMVETSSDVAIGTPCQKPDHQLNLLENDKTSKSTG
jgi:hypothetical protein